MKVADIFSWDIGSLKGIEDADTVNEIVKVLKNSEVYYLGATSYEDLLILTKEDGSEIELQIPPYYPGLYVGEGFITAPERKNGLN